MNVQMFSQLSGANASVSPFLQPADSPVIQNGVVTTYKLGAIMKDTGYSRVGNVASAAKSITGLHNFRQTYATQKILRTRNNDAGTNLLLQYNNSGTWTDINVGATYDLFEDCLTEMEDFIGYCFIVGYDLTDNVFLPVGSLTGTTFSTATNVTSMAQGKYIKRYRDRLYVANCYYSAAAYPYRVYFSSVPSAGAITWTPASDFFDVDFSEQITGIGTNWDRLVIFTEFAAYMYDQSQKKQVWSTGCTNHRTIDTSGPYMFWANYDGVWRSTGGQPENIAGPVIDFIRKGTPSGFVGKIVDEEYWLKIGNVTVDGISYSNLCLIYNIQTSTWRWREMGHVVTVMERYNDSGVMRLYLGTSIGEVYNKAKYTDATLISSDGYISAGSIGTGITAYVEFAPIWLNNVLLMKDVTKFAAYADRAQGAKLQYRILDRNARALTKYKPICQLTNYINVFDVDLGAGALIQFCLSEFSTNPYFSFYGMEFEIDKFGEQLKPSNSR